MKDMIRTRTFLAAGVMAGLLVASAAFGQEGGDMHVMQQHSDWYRIFGGYWWLLFPLGWAIGQLIKNFLRHARAREALQVMKSYADQGKEPPAELIAVLRQPEQSDAQQRRGDFAIWGWIPVCLFAGLTAGFVLMAIYPPNGAPPVAMLFVALIMAGLCIGNLVALMARRKQDRASPP